MTMTTMEKLQERGWYLSENGYELVSDYGNVTDLHQLVKRAVDFDLKEIGSGSGNINEGNIVLQIQKVRNVAAPKNNEESKTAPRMLKLSVTDGKNNYQAVEIERISSLSLNTSPGTKLFIKPGNVPMSHGMILLNPTQIGQILGGNVANLVEKWELNKKLALHSRVRSVEEGGPPPWIPFGKKIMKIIDQSKNFKALVEKEKASKENSEFEAQRKDAIAEAAKQGNKKIFGGGNRQLLDHNVQKIVEQGFSIEQAEYALKVNRNNVDRALKSLQKNDSRQNNSREPRESKGKRFEKKAEETGKPSSGKVSLFDFLEDKLPTQPDLTEGNNTRRVNGVPVKEKPEIHSDRFQQKFMDHSQQSKGGRTQRGGGRNHQNIPRHIDDDKSNKWPANANPQYVLYGASNASQQNKPPRFQRNNDSQIYYQQDNSYPGNFNKVAQTNEYRNTFTQPRPDTGNGRNYGNGIYGKNQGGNNTRNNTPVESRNKNYEMSHSRQNRMQDVNQKGFTSNVVDRSQRNQQNKYYSTDDNYGNRGLQLNSNQQQNENHFGNRQASAMAGAPWVWQKGDKCMAKYWEDNMYYNAEVFDVSETTCVVQFNEFFNFEEVLQEDCIPITEEDHQTNAMGPQDAKRQDYRLGNRIPRHDSTHNQMNAGMEFRRGGGNGSKNYNKRKNQQRSAQPIYQPPAQRNVSILQHTTNTIHS